MGSSPLARGTLANISNVLLSAGLIPARAGNTEKISDVDLTNWAHPRSRGEHGGVSETEFLGEGSSPLARGTPMNPVEAKRAGGLIPARVGNTVQSVIKSVRQRAHPRSRGEHDKNVVKPYMLPGSSPLARGTQHL